MHILLINTNPMVSKLFTHALSEAYIPFESVEDTTTINHTYYDFLFIDEAVVEREGEAYLEGIESGMRILFAHAMPQEPLASQFDTVILKPFLPIEIITLLADIVPTPSPIEEDSPTDTSVLDHLEIAKIKDLLALDTHTSQEDPAIFSDEPPRKTLTPKRKKRAKKPKPTSEHALIEALTTMKPKKLRRLLQGAQITITINFNKDNH